MAEYIRLESNELYKEVVPAVLLITNTDIIHQISQGLDLWFETTWNSELLCHQGYGYQDASEAVKLVHLLLRLFRESCP